MGINPMGINPMGINRENPYNLDECKNNKPSFKENSPCDRTWERKGTKFVGMPANNVTSMLNRELIEIMLPELCEKVMRLHLCYRLNQMQVFSTNNQLPRNKLPIIRMWGFAGCTAWEFNAVDMYREATTLMVNSIGDTMSEVILQYDGDAAYEKKDNKFSHNLMVSVVAELLRKKGIKCHLVISKIDTDNMDKLKEKFGKIETDGLVMRTNLKQFDGTAHFYPNHTDTYFESITLLLKSDPNPTHPSEMPNIELVNSYLNWENPQWNCLCLGGNTKTGINSINDRFFANVVRGYLAAKK